MRPAPLRRLTPLRLVRGGQGDLAPSLMLAALISLAILAALAWPAGAGAASGPDGPAENCPSLLDHDMRTLAGDERVNLCEAYHGQVILMVNTASQCGFTYQYEGLEKLYQSRRDQGLVILGFPSDNFGGQEPGSEEEIQAFCRNQFGIEFPMFEKLEARGGNAHPLFKELAARAGEPRWNFHKYLVDRSGNIKGAWPSGVNPEDSRMLDAIDKALARD